MMGAFSITLDILWFPWEDDNRTDHTSDDHVLLAVASDTSLFQAAYLACVILILWGSTWNMFIL